MIWVTIAEVARVLLTISAVGVAIEVQERLERAGHSVAWDSERRGGAGEGLVDVVLVAGGEALAERIDGWRASPSVPALLVIGDDDDAVVAGARGVAVVRSTEDLLAQIDEALAHRFGTAVNSHVARAALGLSAELSGSALASAIVVGGRSVLTSIVRDALKDRSSLYVAVTPVADELREQRTLEVPEIELARLSTGALTLKTVVERCSLPPLEAGQRIWSLLSAGALRLDASPHDDGTPERRRTRAARAHILAREKRSMPTAYDVLDLARGAYVEDVEDAVRALAYRYAPDALEEIDLGECAEMAARQWARILEARAALYYEEGQKQLNAFVDAQLRVAADSLARSWARPDIQSAVAAAAFARGQAALSSGEVFKAVSEMASAARAQPSHPTYEAYLAWARYRSEVARGSERSATAKRERAGAEQVSLGRRPFAQALVAIGLLCVADGDPESARWHLNESLALNPDLPAASMILRRL